MHPLKSRIAVPLKKDEYLLINPVEALTTYVSFLHEKVKERGERL
jgi:hypothetical protein